MKKLLLTLAVGLLVSVGLLPTQASAAPYCGITWGSLPKSSNVGGDSLTNIRTGRFAEGPNTCFDRMVFDVRSTTTGYHVQYVSEVRADGSGQVIPLNGGAKLEIVVHSPSYDSNGNPTYPALTGQKLPGVNLVGYQTFRDAKFAGSFEGQTTVGLGVRAKLPFRVMKLDHRIVVDVAHYWVKPTP